MSVVRSALHRISRKLKNSIKTNTYVFLGCLGVNIAQAQVPPDAGSILREQQRPTLELPKRPAPPIRLDEPARPAAKPTAERFVLKGLRITGNSAFSETALLALVDAIIGKEVGFAELEDATNRISRYYRERGYLVARAYLPAQDIKDGVVEIAVIEGRFGKVHLNNTSRVRDGVVRNHTDSLPGAPVYEMKLERKLLLLSDLPGVGEARASLSPGTNVGESDVTIEVTPAPLLSGNVELDNHGNRFTGAVRLGARLNIASPLGLGDALSAQATKGFNGLEYGRIGYQLPIGGDGFKVGGAYAQSRYRLGKTFALLEASGESDTYTAEASYPLVRERNANLYGKVSYARSEFQDRVGFFGAVDDKDTRVVQVALSGDARDAYFGGGISVFSLNYASGQLNIASVAARATDDDSARARGQYDKWNLNLLRLQSVSERTSLYLAFAGQKAGKNLDSSEKFVLGGANGVRAYPQGEGSGDSGYLATAELRYSMTWDKLPGVLQPFLFADAGGVTINANPFATTANRRQLAGGGIGVSWARANDFQLKLTVATRIGSQRAISDNDERTRGWVQAIKYF
jgi:hemolysin activation/secretion protein